MAKKRTRPQNAKAYVDGVQELRKGNRAQPIPSGKQYKRKAKYGKNWE